MQRIPTSLNAINAIMKEITNLKGKRTLFFITMAFLLYRSAATVRAITIINNTIMNLERGSIEG
jgi:hypothetical protein